MARSMDDILHPRAAARAPSGFPHAPQRWDEAMIDDGLTLTLLSAFEGG